MKIYNTLTKTLEEFKPQKENEAKIYICGPTVYNAPTLGNLRTYISEDILRRSLKFLGYKVIEVMNITDIEDKIIRDSKAQGISYKELTAKYEKIFLDNLKELNIEQVEFSPHATDDNVIKKMVEIIDNLLEKEIAYISEDGSIYFSIEKFTEYGKLSGLDKREIKIGARVNQDEYEKDNAQDFALWKTTKEDEPSWEGPKGIIGRPGWHIECTAMSTMNLGNTIDIHGGGVDLIFPHHENEIAQSEAYTGNKFVNYWFHTGHLLINGQRMGKSLGNFYTLEDLNNKFKIEPLAFRLLSLSSHYRDSLNFTDESIAAAGITLNKLRNDVLKFKFPTNVSEQNIYSNKLDEVVEKFDTDFVQAISNDFNTPKAVAALFSFINTINSLNNNNFTKDDNSKIYETIIKVDSVLGLNLKDVEPIVIPDDVQKLLDERKLARETKDWKNSDEIRCKINSLGYEVEDTSNGQEIRKK